MLLQQPYRPVCLYGLIAAMKTVEGGASDGQAKRGRVEADACAVPYARPDSPRRRLATLVLAGSVVVAFLAAANATSPLYQRYEAAWHASPLIGTIAFASYAVAVLVGLLWLSRLPTVFGRRRVLFTAICGQIIALSLFAIAGSFSLIVVGRIVQGLASGAAFGALSAMMIEADAERGTIASAASPGAGSGAGALLSGLVVQFLPGPTHTVYLILTAVLAAQALIVLRIVPEDSRRPASPNVPRPRVAAPAPARAVFFAAAPVVFAVWGLSGFYAALSPAVYTTLSGSGAVWPTALPLFILVGSGSLSTVVLRRVAGPALTVTGAVSTLVGLGVTVAAVELGSIGLYLAASAVAGVGFGTGFQGPIRSLVPLATDDERPALLSAVFIVAYGGLGITAVVAGALVSAGASLAAVTVELAIALAVLTSIALCTMLRAGR
ncbi:MFS transporter [Streptomyces sp. NPDC017991]|uniref:MFS transporter n=1 Tax=Streptomyces sp. NPDC017991 TaxID=3365026 RepID=UPI00379FCBBA